MEGEKATQHHSGGASCRGKPRSLGGRKMQMVEMAIKKKMENHRI
jgi:hypothetical protein